jgi:hypothetical protein
MNAMSIAEIARILKITPKAAKSRLIRAGLKPTEYAGPTGMYDPSVVEIIREPKPAGRPKRAPEPDLAKQINKAKKTKK